MNRQLDLADTANLFLVHRDPCSGGVVMMPLPTLIPRQQALNLAGWIVAILDPEGKDFPRLLEAIKKA